MKTIGYPRPCSRVYCTGAGLLNPTHDPCSASVPEPNLFHKKNRIGSISVEILYFDLFYLITQRLLVEIINVSRVYVPNTYCEGEM